MVCTDYKNLFSNIYIAQFNTIAGDFENNTIKIVDIVKNINGTVIFPELSLSGYGMNDVFQRHPFLFEEQMKWLKVIAEYTENKTIFVGFKNSLDTKSSLAIIQNKKMQIVNFSDIVTVDNVKYGILFDINDKIDNADFYILYKSILSGKVLENNTINNLIKLSNNYNKPILHINAAGATDSISHEGKSRLYLNGKIVFQAPAFNEGIYKLCADKKINQNKLSKNKSEFSLDYEDDLERTYNVLIQGIKDYFAKCGLKRAVLGLSGGLDSTVCAVLLADALGKGNVLGVLMPSELTSFASKSDAKKLAYNLGINFIEYPINDMYNTTHACLNNIFDQVQNIWKDRFKTSYTNDNIQARSRAVYLWGIANEFPSCIPIATSDKSEAYMGYATINGDMSGGFAPILDVTKTKLFALARWMNKNRPNKNNIPQSIIDKKPSAELAINSETGKILNAEDALMPYEFMDEVIWYIENGKEQDMLNKQFIYEKKYKISKKQKYEWIEKFYKRMSGAIFKAYIMPPSIIADYPTNIKTKYYQPITSGHINYSPKSICEIKEILSKA